MLPGSSPTATALPEAGSVPGRVSRMPPCGACLLQHDCARWGLRLRWPVLAAAALLAPVAALLAAAVLLALLAAVALLALIAAVALLAAAALLVAAPASLIVPAAPLPALLTPILHPSQLEDSFLLPEGQLEDREGAA